MNAHGGTPLPPFATDPNSPGSGFPINTADPRLPRPFTAPAPQTPAAPSWPSRILTLAALSAPAWGTWLYLRHRKGRT